MSQGLEIKDPREIEAFVLLFLIGGLGVGAAFLSRYYPMMDEVFSFTSMAKEALPYFAVFALVFSVILWRTPNGWKLLLAFIPMSMVFSMFLVMGMKNITNAWLDSAPARQHRALVLRRYYKDQSAGGSKVHRKFFARVKSWRPGRTTETLKVDQAFYAEISPRATIEVETKPGWLGHEWIVSMRLDDGKKVMR